MFEKLCNDLAEKIMDYRAGEIPTLDTIHVKKWVCQFDEPKRKQILQEMIHIISNSYLSKSIVLNFLQKNAVNPKLVGADVKAFWNNVNVLDIQQCGSSQSVMKSLLSSVLKQHGVNINNTNSNSGIYIYLDDVCFSGNRIKKDINCWLPKEIARGSIIRKIIIITMANHSNGKWWAKKEINNEKQKLRLNFDIEFWCCYTFENRRSMRNQSDMFAPKSLSNDPFVEKYIKYLTTKGYPPVNNLRHSLPNQQAPKIFSNEIIRDFIEQEFLIKGSYIKDICTSLPEQIRPLGFSKMYTLGFGSPIVTFNNCPNTAPLVLWVGDPWYPLFPRRVN